MPCFSTIRTKMTDGSRISKALSALGYKVNHESDTSVEGNKNGRRIMFSKNGPTFSVSGDTGDLAGISKQYAEIGVRDWAKRRGYSITETDGTKMTLINRRKG